LKFPHVISYMLFAPAVDAPYLARIVTYFNTLKNWNNTGPNSTKVKFDF